MTRFLTSKDTLAGILTIAIGATVAVVALDYNLGTPRRMGPGFFPVVLGGLLCFVGVLILLGARRDREPLGPIPWRALVVLPLAIAAFALLLPRFGLGPAGIAVVLISGLAQRGRPSPSLAVLAIVLVLAVWLLFAQLLGVPVPLFDWNPR